MSVCNYNYPLTYENVTYKGKTGKMTWDTETTWVFEPDDYSDKTRYPLSQIISSENYDEMPNIPCTELMANAFCSFDSSKVDVQRLHRDWLMNNDPAEYREQYVTCLPQGSMQYELRQRLPTKVANAMDRGDYPADYRGGGSRRRKSKQRKSRKSNKSKKRKSRKAIRRRR